MPAYTLDHISDARLLADLHALDATDKQTTAALLAHLAEVDARQLFRPAACSSMHVYCTRVLHLADEVAYKRIRAARTARRFPQIFDAIADGRLNISNVVLLAPHLTDDNVDDVLATATHRSKAEIEILVARLAPQPDVPATLRRLPQPGQRTRSLQLDPDPVPTPEKPDPGPVVDARPLDPAPGAPLDPTPPAAQARPEPAPVPVQAQLDPDPVRATPRLDPDSVGPKLQLPPREKPAPSVKPIAPERFALKMTISQATRDKLERARALMRHRNASGDLAEVLDRALDALLAKLEKEKFGKTPRPRAKKARPENADPRYVQNAVKREVHERDGEQCTFVSADGVRCSERGFLELDHSTPACRGGQPTTDEIRLLCKTHNQYEAERILGADFMHAKRTAATAARTARATATTRTAAADASSGGTSDSAARDGRADITTTQEPLPGFRCSEGRFDWSAFSSWAS